MPIGLFIIRIEREMFFVKVYQDGKKRMTTPRCKDKKKRRREEEYWRLEIAS